MQKAEFGEARASLKNVFAKFPKLTKYAVVRFVHSRVRLRTVLDDTKYCYQLIITIPKFVESLLSGVPSLQLQLKVSFFK